MCIRDRVLNLALLLLARLDGLQRPAGADGSCAAPAPERRRREPASGVAALALLAFPSLELLRCELGEAKFKDRH